MNKKRVIKLQCPFERIKKYNSKGEVSLYKAVIMQMIIDASNISSDTKAVKQEKQAKEWLFTSNEDFHFICNKAAMEPKTVINFARKLIDFHYNNEFKKSKATTRKSQKTKIYNKIFFSLSK